jgi:hypothetical protein
MRLTVFAALVIGFLLLQTNGGRVQADQPQRTGMQAIVLSPDSARRVTLRRNGAFLASFTVPNGTFLSAIYDDPQAARTPDGRWEFHGNLELREWLATEVQPGGKGEPVTASPRLIRSGNSTYQAALTMTVQGVDAVIENIQQ